MSTHCLIVPGRYSQVRIVCEFVSLAAEQAGLSEHECYQCQLAVDEACTNIINHAYQGEDRGVIDVTCEADDGELTMTLRDQGVPFDPVSIPDPVPYHSIDDVNVGGHGLSFMRRMMTSMHYTCDDTGNTLVMVKQRGR